MDHMPPMLFQKWIWNNRETRLLLILSGGAIFIQFIWFKYWYPYPNFIPDSYGYLDAAFNNQAINMWPIGYSKFLRLFSIFTTSHMALVLFQYLFLQACMLHLLFTLAYLLALGKWTLRIILYGSILNPLLLHISNFVSSDALFTALSLVWFTQLLWILHQPRTSLLVAHAFVLLMVFTVRYNALYYPFISVAVIVLSSARIKEKMAGIVTIIALIGLFVGQTMYKYHTVTGITQFSAFGGWQLASNALVAYAHVYPDTAEKVPARLQPLHTIVTRHMDSLYVVKDRPDATLGIYYLWNEQSPLKKYMYYRYRKEPDIDEFKRWSSMTSLYKDYGAWLIQQYPIVFLKYYLWPNVINYYAPTTEFMGIYNMGIDNVTEMAVTWFGLKSNKVHTLSADKRIIIIDFFPVLLAIINLVFVLSFIGFIVLGGLKKTNTYFKRILWLMLTIWLCNFGFSVLASPIVLRYQIFSMVITFFFLVLVLSFLIQETKVTPSASDGKKN